MTIQQYLIIQAIEWLIAIIILLLIPRLVRWHQYRRHRKIDADFIKDRLDDVQDDHARFIHHTGKKMKRLQKQVRYILKRLDNETPPANS